MRSRVRRRRSFIDVAMPDSSARAISSAFAAKIRSVSAISASAMALSAAERWASLAATRVRLAKRALSARREIIWAASTI